MQHADEYMVAFDGRKTGDWFAGIYRKYFEVFDPSIPDDLEPDNWEVFRIEDQPEEDREEYEAIRAELFDIRKQVRDNLCHCKHGANYHS